MDNGSRESGSSPISDQTGKPAKASRSRHEGKLPTFFSVGPDTASGGPPGWEFVNVDDVQIGTWGLSPKDPWPDGYLNMSRTPWRFPDYVQTPKFVIAKKFGRTPRDLEGILPYWIVSPAMRSVLERVDPEAVEFRPCETLLLTGEPGPERWLCLVTRALQGVVDLERSEYLQLSRASNGKPTLMEKVTTIFSFRPDVLRGAHLFRVAEMGTTIFCDQSVKDACRAADVKGVAFWQRT